ncbi:MAG: GNAT family N-acetyltransferase [Dehalococcoidia bacterium]|nr:GNAT family N-acetyltransferase [Dehalococcoidia bacterium]
MSAELPPKQLSMIISASRAEDMPEYTVPEGFVVRGYLPGDEESWTELLNTGDYGSDWDRTRVVEFLAGPERAVGSVVVARDSRVVAATFASVEVDRDFTGRVDFVTSHPDVRGLGLGRVVCTGVVRYLVGKGYPEVILYTDDWRLPAIGLYLSMGFEPQMTRSNMPERWRRVMKQLEGSR